MVRHMGAERIEVLGAIEAKNLGLFVRILDRKTEWIKFNGTRIVRSKFANRNEIFLTRLGTMRTLFKEKEVRHVQSGLAGVGNQQSGAVAGRDKGRMRGWEELILPASEDMWMVAPESITQSSRLGAWREMLFMAVMSPA